MTNRVIHYQRKRRPNANFSVEFIFADVRQRLAGRYDIEVRIAPYFSNGLIQRLRIIRDVLRYSDCLVHVTGDINFAILGTPQGSGVLTILDCGFLNRPKGLIYAFLKKFWLDLPIRRVRFVTTISNAMKSEIVNLCGCDPNKVVVIPVAIDDSYQPCPKPFPSLRPRLLHLGTAPNKNLAGLVEAVRGLDVVLVVIGKLPSEIENKLISQRTQYENYVDLSREEIVKQYQLADVVCFVSLYEGFGMPILEAQATGRPVITSHVASMPEVAGDAALFVDPTDVSDIRRAIERVTSDQDLREDLIRKGYENVKRFSPDVIAQQYLSLYARVRRAAKDKGGQVV